MTVTKLMAMDAVWAATMCGQGLVFLAEFQGG